MSTPRPGIDASPGRLRLLLLLLILWDVLAVVAELSFGGPLFKLSDAKASGVLAARGGFGGAAVVPLALYAYAFLRGPQRHPGVFWLAAVEQGATALFAVYHVAADDVKAGGMIVPLIVAIALLVLVIVSLPRREAA